MLVLSGDDYSILNKLLWGLPNKLKSSSEEGQTHINNEHVTNVHTIDPTTKAAKRKVDDKREVPWEDSPPVLTYFSG